MGASSQFIAFNLVCHASHSSRCRCADGFTVRALLDDVDGEAAGQQVLLCHVDGFKYDYKVDLNATIAARENFCAASVARVQCLTSLAGCSFGLFAVRQLEQGAIMFKHKAM